MRRRKDKPTPDKDGYPSIKWLLDNFFIEEETGKLIHKEKFDARGRPFKNSLTEAGWTQSSNSSKDYLFRAIAFYYGGKRRKTTKVHRVIWAMTYGYWPTRQIDHIDGNPMNNRIDNLRDVNPVTNARNQKKSISNTSGVCGVSQRKGYGKRRTRWIAYIKSEYKKIHLGSFDTLEEATAARKEAEIKYGFHENHGRDQANAEH